MYAWHNDETDQTSRGARSAAIAGNGQHVIILGNHIYDIWGDGQHNHGIYIDNDEGPPVTGPYEIGWNHVHDITGGNLVQFYGVDGDIADVYMHGNLLHDGISDGINIADNSKENFLVVNNIIYNVANGGIRTKVIGEDYLQNSVIANNTVYNAKTLYLSDWGAPSSTLLTTNNIFYAGPQTREYSFINQPSTASSILDNNLWYGLSDLPPSHDLNSIDLDPIVVSVIDFNFHLLEGSSAIDSGVDLLSLFGNDFNNYIRPIGNRFDVGAHEFNSTD
jgi:hypothetical protein